MEKVIGDLFEQFLYFFLPDLHEEVDFSKPVEPKDKDLHKLIINDLKGLKRADLLQKVYLKNGEEQWILIHIEIQEQDEVDFAKRMFQYFYRIFDEYERSIVAIAIFTNKSKKSTNEFNYLFSGTKLSYTFNKYVLSDFDEETLKKSDKLFSKVLLAGYYYNQSKKDLSKRFQFKEFLLKEITMMNDLTGIERKGLLYFVDFLLALPNDLTKKLTFVMSKYLREEKIDMVHFDKEEIPPTFGELMRMEREEGREEGKKEGKKEGIKSVALQMLKLSMPIEQIAQATGLTIEEIQRLKLN